MALDVSVNLSGQQQILIDYVRLQWLQSTLEATFMSVTVKIIQEWQFLLQLGYYKENMIRYVVCRLRWLHQAEEIVFLSILVTPRRAYKLLDYTSPILLIETEASSRYNCSKKAMPFQEVVTLSKSYIFGYLIVQQDFHAKHLYIQQDYSSDSLPYIRDP